MCTLPATPAAVMAQASPRPCTSSASWPWANDAAPGALEQTTAAWLDELAAATKKLAAVETAEQKKAEEERAAEEAVARGEILP
jgi:hypothetical protein